jgi:hypothetical protein
MFDTYLSGSTEAKIKTLQRKGPVNLDGLKVLERIDEIKMMCDRNNPLYEQISNYSIALYSLGFFDVPDLMEADDLDEIEAADFLKMHFEEVKDFALPSNYMISESNERYLLVIGDPEFPIHFAALINTATNRPFFSKLKFMGSGFDSLKELINEFQVGETISMKDIHLFRKIY